MTPAYGGEPWVLPTPSRRRKRLGLPPRYVLVMEASGAPDVLIVCHTAQLGGAELSLLRLLDALPPGSPHLEVVLMEDGDLGRQLASRGVVVHVLPMAEVTRTVSRHGFRHPVRLFCGAFQGLRTAGALRNLVRERDPRVVHSVSLKSHLLSGCALTFLRPRPSWVWSLHDRLAADYMPAPAALTLRLLARRADGVIANSRATADTLGRDAVVAYPGFSLDQALPEELLRRRTSPASPRFLLLGRISPTKGQLEFVEAAAKVHETRPDASYVIVGSPMFGAEAYAARVRQRAVDLLPEGVLRFEGFVGDPRGHLDSATALVHASPVPEPFGQVVLEAVVRGVPVIATRAGGVPEIVTLQDGSEVASLVEPGDVEALAQAMVTVLDEEERAQRARVRAAYRFATAHFSAHETANVVLKEWARMLSPLRLRPRRPLAMRLHKATTHDQAPQRPAATFLFNSPWQHEFDAFAAQRVPSHRLFFAHEMSQRGYDIAFYTRSITPHMGSNITAWRIRQAIWAVRSRKDVVIATHESAAYMFLLLRWIKLGPPTPVVVLSVAASRATSGTSLTARLKRSLLARADLVTVYSRDQIPALRARLPNTQVFFLPLGVDTEFFPRHPARVPTLDVLSVGTNDGKDYPTLIRALPENRSLTIVTDPRNIEQARPYVGTKNVTFRSHVPIAELRHLYRECTILVLPLKDVEMSTGQTVLLENLALGTPIIATDVPCIRDYVNHSSVVLTRPGDVAQLRQALLERPKTSAQPFQHSAEATADLLETLITDALGGRG